MQILSFTALNVYIYSVNNHHNTFLSFTSFSSSLRSRFSRSSLYSTLLAFFLNLLPPLSLFHQTKPKILDLTADGLYYVEDEEGGLYEIKEFLGDDETTLCQVFLAKYSTGKKTTTTGGYQLDEANSSSGSRRRRKGDEIHQVVALKLARIDDSAKFKIMTEEVENSFKIGPNDDQENNVITDNNIIAGIYKSFSYRNFLCVSMPYSEGGSLRCIVNKGIPDRNQPEKFIAVVLRETLHGLRFLHGRGRVHMKLNAGNIFLGDFHNPFGSPVAFKLGYQGSTYFHNPEADSGIKIFDESTWERELEGICFITKASMLEENSFWTDREMYEPSSREQRNYTPASDIWNLGVLALELSFGAFRTYHRERLTPGDLRTPDEFRSFLKILHKNKEPRLPKLYELFIPISRKRGKKEANKKKGRMSSLVNAGKKVKIFVKKVKVKILGRKPPKPEWPDSDYDNEDLQVSHSFTAMVKRCLVFDPNERPTADILLNDPFFVQYQNADMRYFADSVRSYVQIPPNH